MNQKAARLLAKGLREERFVVDVAHSGEAGARPTVLTVADLTLDSVSHRVTRADQPVNLTRTEYAILEVLMRHAGEVVMRGTLGEHIFGGGG